MVIARFTDTPFFCLISTVIVFYAPAFFTPKIVLVKTIFAHIAPSVISGIRRAGIKVAAVRTLEIITVRITVAAYVYIEIFYVYRIICQVIFMAFIAKTIVS